MGSGAKSYIRKGFLIYEGMRRWSFMTLHPIPLNFLNYEENFLFFFYQCNASSSTFILMSSTKTLVLSLSGPPFHPPFFSYASISFLPIRPQHPPAASSPPSPLHLLGKRTWTASRRTSPPTSPTATEAERVSSTDCPNAILVSI